ncbi:metalloregulator ArsR/SmtB family transcription factor [Isoptericola sp. b515]|uniref:metalloregulator ArsR/SmtB family transcription factor n=1 Tax=Isoptericola sp. b515 TaxID=3064652 RepID=UPI0027126C72|nr:metalloregulator ArsR/SmtB family transcription factor [Isoptericola sp. b515]MDO8147428.1 metalloregulator ArsR/SmtB family transcription factor [Isoptericola sp. b515]
MTVAPSPDQSPGGSADQTAGPAPVPADGRALGPDVAVSVAGVLKALADPLRLRMLSAIATAPGGEAHVGDLAALAEVSQPTVSHHLKVLRDVGVLSADRRGTSVFYRVAPVYRTAVTTLLDRFAPAVADSGRVATPEDPGAGRWTELHGLADVDRELGRLAESLAARIPGTSEDEALRVVRESYTALARRGGIPVHLVALTEHFARQRLADAAKNRTVEAPGPDPDHPPQVLFVCVGNAGRSQLAAALLARSAGDRVVVRSAGSVPAGDVHDVVRPVLEDLGAPDDVFFPKPLTDDAVRAADVVVTMGCGDSVPVLPGKRYEDWVVGDPALASPAGVRAIRDELDARVHRLIDTLL